MDKLDYINIGGGFIYQTNLLKITNLKKILHDIYHTYGAKIFIEPGEAIISDSGILVTQVLDIINKGDGCQIAITDTSIAHALNIFIYQSQPTIYNASSERGEGYRYIIAGRSCLAGDIIGNYVFNERLKIGDRLIILNMGAYTYCKVHWFTGINFPSVYLYDMGFHLNKIKSTTYSDFQSYWGKSQ